MPIDAKLGMSHASTKETVAISGLFSLGQKNYEARKNSHGIAGRTLENSCGSSGRELRHQPTAGKTVRFFRQIGNKPD
jgi:hypothetical protein